MLAIRPRQVPAFPVAQGMLAAVFGRHAVRVGGSLFDRLEARGEWRGLRIRVDFAMHQTRKRVAPFTTIDVEEDIDVAVYTGGAGWPYESYEPFAPFEAPSLQSMAVVGAPRALVDRIARGPVAERLAASGLNKLTLGAEARRAGCATRGVRFEVEGWPMDEATLTFLLDTVIQIAAEARREIASGMAYGRGGRHAELVAYEVARGASRAQGLKVFVAVGVGLSALTMLTIGVVLLLVRS